MAWRTWSLARYGSAWLKSKCSNSRPGAVTLVVFGTWAALLVIDVLTVAGLITWTSLFCRAGTSWVSSVMKLKTILFSLPGVPQYFGLRTRTTDWLLL